MIDARETPTKKVKDGHYVASVGRYGSPNSYNSNGAGFANRGYATDGEESYKAASTYSEYVLTDERTLPRQKLDPNLNYGPRPLSSPPKRTPPRAPSALSYRDEVDGSEIYVTSAAYKGPSEIGKGPKSLYSTTSSVKTGKSSNKRGAKVELMSAPNPFCPNVKGVCCLMLLLNLGLILVTLGFVIVIQFYEPLFVWILGIVFLVFGFATLVGCMIYCVVVCRDAKTPSQLRDEDLYWTRHWQKNIGYVPNEISYKTESKYDDIDKYSDKYSIANKSVASGKANSRGDSRSKY